MRKNLASNPVQQMPQISGERAFNAKSLFQLASNCFNQPAFTSKFSYGLFGQRRSFFVNFYQRCMKIHLSLLPQRLMQGLRAITLVSQRPAALILSQQRLRISNIMLTGRCQNKVAGQSNICNFQVQPIAKECLPKQLSMRSRFLKLFGRFCPDELTDLNRHAVQYLQIVILKTAQTILQKGLSCLSLISATLYNNCTFQKNEVYPPHVRRS